MPDIFRVVCMKYKVEVKDLLLQPLGPAPGYSRQGVKVDYVLCIAALAERALEAMPLVSRYYKPFCTQKDV